jgi:hypothetical protein
MSSTAGAIEVHRARSVEGDLRGAIWLTILALACGLSLFLTWRRLVGALVQPPAGAALVCAAFALAISAALLRRAAPRDSGREIVSFLPGVVAVLLLAAVTLPGTPAVGIAIAWLALIASETTAWLAPRVARRGRADAPSTTEESEIPEGLLQQLTRVREGDRESIHGLLQAEVPAADRLAVVHLAFCPPLAARPELTAHAMDSDDAEVRVTQVEVFGARMEVRLPRPADEPRRVLIEVLGSVTCPTGD